jgi:predicted glutamine amidotransferase
VSELISLADDRGGHSYGIYAIRNDNTHFVFKSHGRSDIGLLLSMIKNCQTVIGHSRLATSGDLNLLDTQPIVNKNDVIVHNGNIPFAEVVYKLYNYTPVTNNDSEALIPMINDGEEISIEGAFLHLKLDYGSHKLTSYENHLPLYQKTINETTYYCSKKWEKY